MSSSLFRRSQPQSQVQQLKQLAQGNPQGLYNRLMSTNPQFRDFVQSNAGKTPQQIAQEHGIPWGDVENLLR